MSYTVFGLRGALGRVASHSTIEGVAGELAAMRAAGFTDLKVARPFTPMVPADVFMAAEARELESA